jgi:hypothetical protein
MEIGEMARGAADESRYSAIHPEIPHAGSKGSASSRRTGSCSKRSTGVLNKAASKPGKPTAFATLMWKVAPPSRREIHQSLLLVILDDLGGTHFGFIRVFTELAECPALPQQVPALVEMHFQLGQMGAVFTGEFTLGVKLLFFLHQTIDAAEYGFVVLVIFIEGHVRLL